MTINNIQRDLGRIESKVEMQSEDIKDIKNDISKLHSDLSNIKEILAGTKARSELGWTQIGLISLFATFVSQIFTIAKHWITS